ncbi:phosphate acyltransferase PlsX [Peptococcus simiae]|uniref:Phosphate acyltransferase n=1 Tax=Peptococcus simiae TaxID=1643805 RepID=A0ABW9GZH6_9FIRM
MKIAVDAMGGDYAPKEVVLGACQALQQFPEIEEIVLVGDEAQIKPFIDEQVKDRLSIVHTDEVIGMNEHPATAFRQKKQASVRLATDLVRDGHCDGIVSCGNTGAQMASAIFRLGRIKGIKRPAIAVLLPTLQGPKLLVDAGANTQVDPDNLLDFATMGAVYMQLLTGQPAKVALINNGAEEEKGSDLTQASHQLLKQSDLHFIGNIEGREITEGTADVMVCDGFTGNVILKTLEGFGKNIFKLLKREIEKSARYKMGALLLKPAFYGLKDTMDPKAVGGAPLLGVKGVSIVCHGNSDARAVVNGILVAKECIEAQLISQIEEAVAKDGMEE